MTIDNQSGATPFGNCRPTRRSIVLASLLAPLALPARAETAWPSKPITYVVPYPPGGTTDILGRTIAQGLTQTLGVSVIVENKPGATGTIGGGFVARAEPDGYTLLGTSIGPQTIVPHLMKLPYDAAKAYEPIILVGTVPHLLAVKGDSPYNSVQDLIAAAKANPGAVSFASGGLGTILQIQGELLRLQTDTKMLHVPYKGDVPAMQDVMSGQVTFVFIPVSAALTQVQAGKLKALAATSAKRLPELQQTPTMAELGFKDFVVEQWQAIYAPAKTPAQIVQRLNEAINQILKAPDVVARFGKAGVTIVGGTPEDLAQRQAADYERWRGVIKAADIKIE
ncbi:MAG: tripartite tricarboxylate transporter substrate binding protein [Hyphomicrobiales bacterium]|nr:tripartite tricarboxylate transporter substrate binding protein [Hyphomicrobiales bacterium]